MKNWPGILIGLILGALILRGGLPALVPLLRFALIFFLIYFVIRTLRGIFFVKGAFDHMTREAARHQGGRSAANGGGGGTTIDICPQCGDVLGSRHHCRPS